MKTLDMETKYDILRKIYDVDTNDLDDLRVAIILNPSLGRITQAMDDAFNLNNNE